MVRVVCAKKKEVQGMFCGKAGPGALPETGGTGSMGARRVDIALQNAEGTALFRLVHDLLGGRFRGST